MHIPNHLHHVPKNYSGFLRHIKRRDAEAAAHAVRQNLHQTVLSIMEHFAGKDMPQTLADSRAKSKSNATRRAYVTPPKP